MRGIAVLFTLIFFSCSINAQKSQLSILENNWKAYLYNEEIKPEMLPYYFNLNPDGSWSDIDYTNEQRGNWPSNEHLKRTVEMAKSYQKQGNKDYKNKILCKNILLAFCWWVDHDFINPNWWYPQIGVPQNLGVVMLLMKNEIDAEHFKKGMSIMDRVVFGERKGQNLVWVSSNIALRCILKKDTISLDKATRNICKEMQIAHDVEGLQPDYSFHQHGPQLQFGNYGLSFLEDQVKWMFTLKGSKYDYKPEQIDLIRNYFALGQRWIIWKNVYDINCNGRQVFPNEQLKKYNRVCKAAMEMKKIDPKHCNLYQSISGKNKLKGVRHFPFSELTVSRTDKQFTSIRMCSSRIRGSESGNGENLCGYYLADGAMYVMKTGKEYLNIFPYWDWRKIPGTTSVQDTVKLPEIGWESYTISSDFVGGLTQKKCAITSMQYSRDGVSANKSYFVFPDFTVCLGSGIYGQKEQHLQTTIEQCFSTTPLYVYTGKMTLVDNAEPKIVANAKIFWHQDSGYIINQGKNIAADSGFKTANWSKIVNWISKKEELKKVVTLGIDHGKNVNNETYAYAVFPNMNQKDLIKTYNNQPYQILSNTHELQAVKSNAYTAVVFHQPGKIKLNDSIELSSSVPALLLCVRNKNQLHISISDPTQKLISGQITLTKYSKSRILKTVKGVTFPIGPEKGTAVVFNIVNID